MLESLIPIVVCTSMFAMIFGIAYIRSRENMALIEKGLNPRIKDASPRPFLNLKWGLLLMGAGVGLLFAYLIDHTLLNHPRTDSRSHFTFGRHHSGRSKSIVIADTTSLGTDTGMAAINQNNIDNYNDGDDHSIAEMHGGGPGDVAIYFALIAIGGGLGLFLSYRIEKKEWLDKRIHS
jgi:hypothetical protein